MQKNELDKPLMVSVRCATYNHVNYIRQCLDGFVMQKTNFRFEVIVHDDASTDGTTEIVREYAEKYPEIIKPMYEETNQYSVNLKAMNARINAKLTGKYIAICEGDDFWTDPNKLQIQCDFMEAHDDYSLCFHPVSYIENGLITRDDKHSLTECDFSAKDFIHEGGLFSATASLFFRAEYQKEMPKFREMAVASGVGDSPLQVLLALRGKVHYFPTIMGSYRFKSSGSWTATNYENKVNKARHFLSGIEWYKELDNYTNGVYREQIYHRICLVTIILFQMDMASFKDVRKALGNLSYGKDKLRHIKTLSLCLLQKKYPAGYLLCRTIYRGTLKNVFFQH